MLRVLFALFISFSLLYPTAKKDEAGAFLWEVKSDRSKVYLLGSIHIAKQNLFPLKKSIESAYEESELVAVEIDTTKAGKEIADMILKSAFFTNGADLKGSLSKEAFSLLEKHLENTGYRYEDISAMRPWYVSIFFTKLSLEKIEAKSMFGIDSYFINKAYSDKKEIVELENAKSQISLMASLPAVEQEYLLKSSILEDAYIEESLGRLIEIWEAGNIEEMEKFFEQELSSVKELKAFNDKFIIKRNRQMCDKIDGFIKDGKNIIVIIGAAHFMGQDGIISLLKKRGYEVIQK